MGKTDDIIAKVAGDVTKRLIEAIENGDTGEWTQPWRAITARQRNPLSGATYTGINPLILAFVQVEREYERPLWVTFNQQRDAGGKLVDAKGKGVQLIRWNFSLSCSTHGNGKYRRVTARCCDDVRSWSGPSTFYVFNIAHIEGIDFPEDETSTLTEPERYAEVEEFVKAIGANVRWVEQNRAFYTPSRDTITMPSRKLFHDERGMYSTLLHEVTHWSGGANRLDRTKGTQFGDNAYAAEELIAELGAAILMQQFGLEAEPHLEHAAYLRSWLKALKSDSKFLHESAKLAAKAVAYLNAAAEGIEAAA